MLDEEFPIPLDNHMTCVATLLVLLGAILVRSAGWQTVGWTVAAFGIVTLWLAHHVAIAACYDEPAAVP
jgi:hypothetical protein